MVSGSVSGPVSEPRTVRIRSLQARDAPAVGALTLAAYDRYGRIDGDYRTFLGDPLQRVGGSTDVLVAMLGDQVVGTATFILPEDAEWEGRPTPEGDASFRVLAVAPGFERLGIGRRLVQACIQRARDRGCHRLVITSMEWMGRAHALYQANGFVRRPDLDVRFPSGRGVVFSLDLTADAPQRFAAPGPPVEEPPWYDQVWDL